MFIQILNKNERCFNEDRHSMGSIDDFEIFERQINKILFLLFIYNLSQQLAY